MTESLRCRERGRGAKQCFGEKPVLRFLDIEPAHPDATRSSGLGDEDYGCEARVATHGYPELPCRIAWARDDVFVRIAAARGKRPWRCETRRRQQRLGETRKSPRGTVSDFEERRDTGRARCLGVSHEGAVAADERGAGST